MRKNCGELYEQHWQCLERHNQKLYPCRLAERRMNECVFDKMVRFSFVSSRSCLYGLYTESDSSPLDPPFELLLTPLPLFLPPSLLLRT